SRYGLQAFAILLISALLLLHSTFRGALESSPETKRSSLTDRRLRIKSIPVVKVPTSSAKSIGLPFGHQDLAINFSSGPSSSVLLKRAPPREHLAWPTLVCNGRVFLERIKAAFEGSGAPGREFWTTVPPFPRAIPATSLDKVQKQEIGDQAINVKQDKNYQTNDGTQITNPTKAFSNGLYVPEMKLIISLNSLSPANVITKRNIGISKENRDKQLPPLSKLSDIIWLNWKTNSPNPKELRYIAHNKIINKQSGSAMDYLFLRPKEDIPFPGLEYSRDSEELKALLATPNGIAVAWILIDHASELKGRDGGLTRRELKVNIFEVDRDQFMLWDIEAESPR
ncbi:MAG: hypothetical protein L6R42_002565, partial [Xanthoria sp. 1 TBL-2021]